MALATGRMANIATSSGLITHVWPPAETDEGWVREAPRVNVMRSVIADTLFGKVSERALMRLQSSINRYTYPVPYVHSTGPVPGCGPGYAAAPYIKNVPSTCTWSTSPADHVTSNERQSMLTTDRHFVKK